ncbi:MoxR-like ATPase [Cutibacterium acnes JCM 18920]|nr:MoxR-like ATPase [Cutibacterium acnes JCM 18920]
MSTQHYSDGQDIGKGNQDAPMSNDEAARLIGQAIGQVQRVIVGQERMVEQLMVGVLAKGHILLEGVPASLRPLPYAPLRPFWAAVSHASSSLRTSFLPTSSHPHLLGIEGNLRYRARSSLRELRAGR